MRLTEIRIAGFGGQGVILSAIIIGKAASIFQGAHATMTQNFGPESRGGACSAQVVLSDDPILYPYMKDRLKTFCPDYYKAPEKYIVKDDQELKQRYTQLLQLLDTTELRLDHLCRDMPAADVREAAGQPH